MDLVALLFPDFSLILIGFVLIRVTDWGTPFWAGLEKMVYFVLFPCLLFYSTARTSFDFGTTGKMLQVAIFATLSGIALGWLAKPLFRSPPMLFESGVQTAFRFNSYIALALASRLGGEQGTSLMAVIMGFIVPLCNMAAVHALARNGGGLLQELVKNPLLIATAGGMLFNVLGLHIPDIAGATLSRMANASIALGLIAVGAGLRLSGLHAGKSMATWFLAVKLLAVPSVVYLAGRWFGLPALQLQIVVMFAALPTAPSAYVLAARMGGNGPFVAFLVSASTVLSALTLPIWLGLAR